MMEEEYMKYIATALVWYSNEIDYIFNEGEVEMQKLMKKNKHVIFPNSNDFL